MGKCEYLVKSLAIKLVINFAFRSTRRFVSTRGQGHSLTFDSALS